MTISTACESGMHACCRLTGCGCERCHKTCPRCSQECANLYELDDTAVCSACYKAHLAANPVVRTSRGLRPGLAQRPLTDI